MSTHRRTSRTIELHIAELVLHGLGSGDYNRLTAAIEQELARLLAEQGIAPHLQQGADISVPDGGTFDAALDSPPEAAGARIAQAVHRGLRR